MHIKVGNFFYVQTTFILGNGRGSLTHFFALVMIVQSFHHFVPAWADELAASEVEQVEVLQDLVSQHFKSRLDQPHQDVKAFESHLERWPPNLLSKMSQNDFSFQNFTQISSENWLRFFLLNLKIVLAKFVLESWVYFINKFLFLD